MGDRKHRGAAGRLGRDQAAAIDVALRDHAIERSDDLLIALLLIVIIQLLLHRREIALSSSRPMPPSLRHTNRCRFALAAPIHRWQGWRYACWSNLSRRAEPLPGPNDCGHDPDGDWRPGEEQNARWRAIAGGLLFATLTTLLIVPYLFALLRKGSPPRPSLLTPDCDSTPPPDGTNGRAALV